MTGDRADATKRRSRRYMKEASRPPSGMKEIKFFMEKPLLFCAIVGIISVDRVQAKPLFCRQWRKQGRRVPGSHRDFVPGGGKRRMGGQKRKRILWRVPVRTARPGFGW